MDIPTEVSFETVPLASIKLNPNNAREHSRKQLAKLARSIEKFGFITPVVVDEAGELLCGHARVLAAREVNIQAIPAVRACHLSEAEKRAFVLADNRLAELASWNAISGCNNSDLLGFAHVWGSNAGAAESV